MKIQTLVLGPVNANCYVVTDGETDETAVIDCGECTEELLDVLDGKQIKYILLTHGHADHILGVYDLKKHHPEAQTVIHFADENCLADEDLSLGCEILPGAQKPVTADITVENGDILTLGSLEIEVMHTPGHTKGSVCYYIRSENTIFTGDTLFCLTVGRTDFEGGSEEEMYDSILRLYNMQGDYDIFPGHNRSTTMKYEKRRNRYMRKFK